MEFGGDDLRGEQIISAKFHQKLQLFSCEMIILISMA